MGVASRGASVFGLAVSVAQDHARYLVLDREADVYYLTFGIVVGVRHHHAVIVVQGDVVEAAKNRSEERVFDVSGDEGPVPGSAGPQRSTDLVAAIAGPLDGSLYSSRLRGVDSDAVQHTRDCGRRYVGCGSNLAHSRHTLILGVRAVALSGEGVGGYDMMDAEDPARDDVRPVEFLSVGDIGVDVVASVDHLPSPGEKLWVDAASAYPGGMAANAAAVYAALGGTAGIVGRVGPDSHGSDSLADLKARGVDTSFVEHVTDPTFWTVALSTPGGERSLIQFETAALWPQPAPGDIDTMVEATAIHTMGRTG